MYNLVDLTDKKILVIGASQGIGAQVALTLSKLGAHLILSSRNEDKLEQVLDGLEGSGHRSYVIDVNNLERIEPSIKEIVGMAGALDGMVYCAGITEYRPLMMERPSAVETILRVNLQGFIEAVRCVTKKKIYNLGMRIVGISSVSSLLGTKAHTAYSASKAGMDGAVRSMAVELAEKGICINTVLPGFISNTDVYIKALNDAGEKVMKEKEKRQYLGLGLPEDVANTVAFLISPAAKFITGVSWSVDGGFSTN